MRKPVSNLIEKIRQRKLQLSQSVTKVTTTNLGSSVKVSALEKEDSSGKVAQGDDEVEFVMAKSPTRLVVKQESGEPSASGLARDEENEIPEPMNDTNGEGEDASSQPSTPDIRLDWSHPAGNASPAKSSLRAPLLESQDLYSDSQLSAFKEDSPVPGDDEDLPPVALSRMNLHLDSETQDNDRWLEEDEKENKEPKLKSPPERFATVSDVRGLVDDEAEDEDEDEDDDSMDDEGDERQDTASELKDLLTQDVGEKPADIERRAELHTKWLEQQDLAMEDNILHKRESGRNRKRKKEMPSLLSDALEGASKGDDIARPLSGVVRLAGLASADIVSPLEAFKKHVRDDVHLLNRTTAASVGLDQDRAHAMTPDDYCDSSDDEVAEENLRRQLFLQESEEKIEFLSVADDESSREIFSIINKVNVATIKPRTTAHHEVRSSATGHHQPTSLHHQSSFVKRKAATSATTVRHGSGNSRSYVFGRDDSNSRDASRQDNNEQAGKVKASNEQMTNAPTVSTQKGVSKRSVSKEVKSRGPSLFQVLKEQAAELASGKTPLDLSGSSSKGDHLSIFLAMKPSRQSRGPRAT